MEPLLKDTLNKGHHRKYLSTKDTSGGTKNRLSYGSNTFSPVKSGQPLYSGQKLAGLNVSFIQRFHCIPIYDSIMV